MLIFLWFFISDGGALCPLLHSLLVLVLYISYVDEVEPLEYVSLKQGRFTMPYLYTIDGADQWEFMIYLQRYMEEGDVLELLYIENQNDSMHDHLPSIPLLEPIEINIRQRTYQTIHGSFNFPLTIGCRNCSIVLT